MSAYRQNEFDTLLSERKRRSITKYKLKYKRVMGEQLIVHRYKKVVPLFAEMVKEGKLKNAFKNSDLSDLAIVTIHNYDEKTLVEQSLDFFGVEDYTVLKHSGEWKMVYKFTYLLEFIEECKKPYILYCDARDSIFTDDPAKIVSFFKKFECEALFNATMSPRGIFHAYKWALPLYWWTRIISRTGPLRKYPNAGAFIGKKQIIKEISEIIVFYCDRVGYRVDSESDQDVLRAIFPWFWPRMKVDYYNKIFYRN